MVAVSRQYIKRDGLNATVLEVTTKVVQCALSPLTRAFRRVVVLQHSLELLPSHSVVGWPNETSVTNLSDALSKQSIRIALASRSRRLAVLLPVIF